jgi:hypothetical protein
MRKRLGKHPESDFPDLDDFFMFGTPFDDDVVEN